jgi:multidrug resistance protein MdtO
MTLTETLTDELTLSPARTARMLRMTAIVALVVMTSMALRVPEVAISAYMIFFFAQRDAATTVLAGFTAIAGLTVALALCLVCLLLTIAEPAARLPAMVAIAFGGMYLMRATPLGPLGLAAGFITFYVLTFPSQIPSPELLVRGVLWLWVVIAYPIALLVLSDLAFGSRPEEVYREGIAERLAAAGEYLVAVPEREADARARLSRFVRLGATDLIPYVTRGGPTATAPIRASLLRQTELLGLLVQALPGDLRRSPTAEPALHRAGVACHRARDALLRSGGATDGDFTLLTNERRALEAAPPATRAIVLPLVTCIQTILLSVRALSAPPAALALHAPPSPPPASASESIRFALKVTLAAMSAYLLYSGLEWYSIHTATITCFFVAQDSVGATIHKLTLRLCGAIVGATLGILAILFVLPALQSVGGLVILVAAVTLLAAWVGTAGPRISYAGWQIALSFYLTVLQGFSRTSKLYVGRDRVIGILLGNILMSVVFSSVWPVRRAPAERRILSRAIEALAAMLRATRDDQLERAAADFYANVTKARQYLPELRFERARGDRGLLLAVVQGLFIPIHAMVRSPVPASASHAARAALPGGNERVSIWLDDIAEAVAIDGPTPPLPASDPALAELDRIANSDVESAETRSRVADQVAWIDLLRAQHSGLAEQQAT